METVTSETEQLRDRIKSLEVDNDRLRIAAVARAASATRTSTASNSPTQVLRPNKITLYIY